MIRHLIREERAGGFWFVRDEGRAVELTPAAYRYLERLARAGGDPGSATTGGEGVAGPGLQDVVALAQRHGLHRPDAWRDVRWVQADAPRDRLPADACAAPNRIYFEITRRCNLGCRSCFNASGRPLRDEFTREEALEVNRQAGELGVFEVRYTGGECTRVPWFPDLVGDAKARGLYVSVGSNGVYSEAMLDWLPGSGIDWLILSLDGDRETNDRIRGAGSFDAVLRTLDVLSRRAQIRLRLNMVVARHNLTCVEAVARVAAEHRVESLNLIPLRPYGRSLRRMAREMLDQTGFYAFIREVNRVREVYPAVQLSTTIDLLRPEPGTSGDLVVQKKATCAAGVEACVVGPRGDVYGCSYSPASFPDAAVGEGWRLFVAGSLRRDGLRAIWRDSRRWAVFRDLEHYKHPKCKSCRHYTVRCSGSCPIMAWHAIQSEADGRAGGRAIARVCDPYCFVDLIPEHGRSLGANTDPR